MKIYRAITQLSVRACFVLATACVLVHRNALSQGAAVVWNGPNITFNQPNTDPTDPADQDRLTSHVWLTRAGVQGLFNEAQEGFYTKFVSPVDTEWAYGTLAAYLTLQYKDWQDLSSNNPPSMVGQQAVVHLKTDNIYLAIEFTRWDDHGGTFAYVRSTAPVPEPATCVLLLTGSAILYLSRRK